MCVRGWAAPLAARCGQRGDFSKSRDRRVCVASRVADSKPSESEADLYTACNEVLGRGSAILDKLLHYKGCEEHIRKVACCVWGPRVWMMMMMMLRPNAIVAFSLAQAITNPSAENEETAWKAVLPAGSICV